MKVRDMTKLCAEAMGYELRQEGCTYEYMKDWSEDHSALEVHPGGTHTWVDGNRGGVEKDVLTYDPLKNVEQNVALEDWLLTQGYSLTKHKKGIIFENANGIFPMLAAVPEIRRRCIVEFVAKLKKAGFVA